MCVQRGEQAVSAYANLLGFFNEFLNMGGRRQSLELGKDTSLYERQSNEARALVRPQHQKVI